jgi:hypothetical protein
MAKAGGKGEIYGRKGKIPGAFPLRQDRAMNMS